MRTIHVTDQRPRSNDYSGLRKRIGDGTAKWVGKLGRDSSLLFDQENFAVRAASVASSCKLTGHLNPRQSGPTDDDATIVSK